MGSGAEVALVRAKSKNLQPGRGDGWSIVPISAISAPTSRGNTMDLDEFQRRVLETDNTDRNYEGQEQRKDIIVAILGIAGELGTLATAHKKFLRDGPSYEPYREDVREEIGDLLWYIAALAAKYNLSLSEVAGANLSKTLARWGESDADSEPFYDDSFPEHERIPRMFSVTFREVQVGGRVKVALSMNGEPLGDPLTDNAIEEDNYRYHDALHLGFLTVLGWSPVVRKLMGRKRKSCHVTDETEDGGRAMVIEEGIAAYIFEYAEQHNRLEGVRAVDFDVLKTAKNMTQRLEVRSKSWRDWESAIMQGFAAFRELSDNRRGTLHCDLSRRLLTYTAE